MYFQPLLRNEPLKVKTTEL